MANVKSLNIGSSGINVTGVAIPTVGRTVTVHIQASTYGTDGTVDILVSAGTASDFVILDDPLTSSGKASYSENTVRIIEGLPASWLVRCDLIAGSTNATSLVAIVAD